jgi:sugar phosphate isomerase/epimerase/pimeloyl-ACP methyl ester carboxylesterase
MRLGIFAKTFVRPTLEETLDAVRSAGFDCIQFNFSCAGLPSMPDKIPKDLPDRIRHETARRKIEIAAVSGTFNMIDPDPAKRREGLRRLEEMAAHCAAMGTSLITLCTGSRDAQDMWRRHPDNDSPEAWRDLLESMAAALEIANRHHVFLGVEPEIGNVVSSAAKARQLLDELKSPRLKIVLDPANLFHPKDPTPKEEILAEAVALLGADIMLAHAKDFREGVVPWTDYLRHLRTRGFAGPLILHGMAEAEVADDLALLKKRMTSAEHPARLPISGEFFHDGIHFNYQDAGRGLPFIFLHGLGGSVAQPFGLFQPPAGFRLISFDCRGHGLTHPVGPDEKISLAQFSDDLGALMDHLRLEKAIVGGISMGAAVALNFTLRHPQRVRGLVLQRPAWLDAPRRENVEIYAHMARLIREFGPAKGLDVFKASPEFEKVARESPPAAKSFLAYFLSPRAAETVALLERIPLDSPNHDRAEWSAIHVPTLVLANRQDPVHPFDYGVTLAQEIPGAAFKELTPKAVDPDRHNAEVQEFLDAFLLQHF